MRAWFGNRVSVLGGWGGWGCGVVGARRESTGEVSVWIAPSTPDKL